MDPVGGGQGGHEGARSSWGSPTTTSRRPTCWATSRTGRPADLFRFANDLRAWIEVDDGGAITGHGYAGGGLIGSTTMRPGRRPSATFQAVAYPDLQAEPEVGEGWVRFTQTAGGRTGVPAPRRVAKPPVRPVPRAHGVVDAVAHDPRRRPRRVGPRRRQPVPPPLGLRARRRAGRQVGPGRLQGLVPPRVRRLQPVGRRGLAGARDGGRVGHGARAVAGDHGRGRSRRSASSRRARSSPSRARRRTPSTSCSTASSRCSWTARRSPTWARRADRGAGGARGRSPHGDARRGLAVPGRGGRARWSSTWRSSPRSARATGGRSSRSA